jgi:glutathione S-transferase
MGKGPWIAGATLTLADLHAAPVFTYFRMAGEGMELLARHPGLAHWWDLMSARRSMAATRSPLEGPAAGASPSSR